MVDIAAKRALRTKTLQEIYRRSGASESVPVNTRALRDDLDVDDREMGDACDYLAGEGCIRVEETSGSDTPLLAYITHEGIVEAEGAADRG